MSDQPTLRLQSTGVGVQSTAVFLLASGLERFRFPGVELPRLDGAIFADTGWEPKAVYDQLERLRREVAEPAGVPIHHVAIGNLRDDALDPEHRFASMPLYIRNPPHEIPVWKTCPDCAADERLAELRERLAADPALGDEPVPADLQCPTCGLRGTVQAGTRPATLLEREGMTRRQCTSEYKLKPIKEQTRRLLGAPDEPNQSGRVRPGRVPAGRWAEQWVGISTDEIGRARDSDVSYARNWFPLLEIGWSRKDCLRYLERVGWGDTPKSACIGCPFHGNRAWRELRDQRPDEWADAVDFDARIRSGHLNPNQDRLDGEAFLHRSRVPLSLAPIDRRTSAEHLEDQVDLLDLLRDEEMEEPEGCSPFACRSDGL